MLVLTRKKEEFIKIGDSIFVKVIQTGKNVKIGVDAPKDVRIMRGELCGNMDASRVMSESFSING